MSRHKLSDSAKQAYAYVRIRALDSGHRHSDEILTQTLSYLIHRLEFQMKDARQRIPKRQRVAVEHCRKMIAWCDRDARDNEPKETPATLLVTAIYFLTCERRPSARKLSEWPPFPWSAKRGGGQ